MARLALLALLGSVEALDCNDQAPSACCDAQRAWSQMEAAGGCGSAEDPLCSRAETLCQQCRSAIDTLRSAAESDGLELDQKLSNLGVGFLEMRCVLPERVSCHGLSDLSFLALLGAAGGLLLLGALGLVLFDQRALPCLAARLRENGAGAGGKAMGSQLPQTAGAPGPDALRLAAALPSGTAQLGHDPSAGLAPALVLRRIFVWIASVGVSARLALLAGYAALLQRDFLEVAAEMLLCLLPLIWCACTTSGSISFLALRHRCPRFTIFAVIAIAAEMYSAVAAAMAVAAAPCDEHFPWRTVLLYCLGVLATVLRCYSAVLAVRLEEATAAACRRVLPHLEEMDDDGPVAEGDIQCSLELEEPKEPKQAKKRSQAAAWREREEVEAPMCACLPRSCCPALRRRRFLVRGGIVVAVTLAVLSGVLVRALWPAPAQVSAPSSCGVARNSTTTCVPWQLAGTHLFDKTGELEMDLANTLEDCCGGCDGIAECQAWIFERVAKRCRWIRFEDKVCERNPENLGCRCLTHWGTAFGFKAKSNLVWLTAT